MRGFLITGLIGLSVLGGARPAFADHSLAYVVRPGDTATGIARQYGVPLSALATTNPLIDLNVLAIGETLIVRPPDIPLSASSPAPTSTGAHYPSFDISPDGVVRRSLTSIPPIPPILLAPYYSQFDGTIWAQTNCGPTTLAMALGALGIQADQLSLRTLANRQMEDSSPDNGTTWESLVYAARQNGVSTSGLYANSTYRTWTLDDLKADLALGQPVMLLVRYWDLPDHLASTFAGDHYIVVLGVDDQGNVIYHDSAVHGDGSYRRITPKQLLTAWSEPAVGLVRTAMAFEK